MTLNGCTECLKQQRELDRLTEALQRLRQTLRYQERQATEGFFGSATPSAKWPVNATPPPSKARTRKGAQPGHPGAGRHACDASQAARVVDIAPRIGNRGPDCNALLEDKGTAGRAVLESCPVQAERVIYQRPKQYGPQGRRTCQPRAPAVLPKSLSVNQRIATATTRHDLHGIPVGRVCDQTGLGPGSLVEILHRGARVFASIPERLLQDSRLVPVKHADETGWRTNGHKGSAWRFATPGRRVAPNRSSASPGCLVVERYGGYHKLPCAIQYCSSHLLREVQDLEQEFPDTAEVQTFVSTAAPQLAFDLYQAPFPLLFPEGPT